ncbi:MAG: ribonuclease HI [Ginsengibacter sp.]
MNWEDIPEIDLYSDGGAEPNPGKGGFGVIMTYKGNKKEFCQGYQLTTNNRMELMGVIYGLEKLKTKSVVNVYTDSRYVVDGITKGWAEKWKSKNWYRKQNSKAINHDLWSRLLALISTQQEVKFNWVKGHAGHTKNERCDVLANIALNGGNLLEDVGYEPKEDLPDSDDKPYFQENLKSIKVKNEGDLCRKCGTNVVKRETKKKDAKPHQTYYFEYYLLCPKCKTMYMVDEAKRNVSNQENNLFD